MSRNMFLSLDKKRFQWEKCRNISVASKQHSLNNKCRKYIRKVIETINNKGEKGLYWYIHNTYQNIPMLSNTCMQFQDFTGSNYNTVDFFIMHTVGSLPNPMHYENYAL